MADNVLYANDVTVSLGDPYIGSAYSPQVTVEEIEGGHAVTITSDVPGEGIVAQTFDVLDGDASQAIEDAEAAAAAARAAASSASSAATSATNAASAASTAAGQATTAAGAATDAASAATGAAASASAAAEDATGAAGLADDAATAATAAASNAGTATREAIAATTGANNAAATANAAAGSAAIAAADATTAAGTATDAATSATSAASAAGTAAEAANTAATAANAAAEVATEAAEGITDAWLPRVTVGAADGITGGGPTDSSAWLQRACPGTDGPATIGAVHGRTLVWNQLVGDVAARVTSNGVTATRNADGSVTLSGTSTATALVTIVLKNNVCTIIANHRYLLRGGVAGGSSGTYYMNVSGLGPDYGNGSIFSYDSDINVNLRYTFAPGVTFDNVVCRPQLFDLTCMFGAGNEPTTVAEFEALFPEPYYPYDAGSLLSVSMEGVGTVGFNQWDEQWEGGQYSSADGTKTNNSNNIRCKNPIPVFPSTAYYYKGLSGTIVYFYDADGTFISYQSISADATFTTPANAWQMTFAIGSSGTPVTSLANGTVCINFSGPRNGEYEPYWRFQRAIDAGVLRGAGSVYDEQTATEHITRVGVVDLGTLNWNLTGDAAPFFIATPSDYQTVSAGGCTISCAKYEVLSAMKRADFDVADNDKKIAQITNIGANSRIGIMDTAYTDAATFKAAMSGVMLHYALATPTTTPIDPALNLTYKAAAGGTERILHDEPTAPPTMVVQYGSTADGIRDRALEAIAAHDGPVAQTYHAVGTYLTLDGMLYKVTTAIAAGERITQGTNVVATTVMAEVLALTQ